MPSLSFNRPAETALTPTVIVCQHHVHAAGFSPCPRHPLCTLFRRADLHIRLAHDIAHAAAPICRQRRRALRCRQMMSFPDGEAVSAATPCPRLPLAQQRRAAATQQLTILSPRHATAPRVHGAVC